MSSTRLLQVNAGGVTHPLNIDALLAPFPARSAAPIDEYYRHVNELVRRSGTADAWLLRLMLLDLISATELFFRRVLAGAVTVCPLIRALASKQMLSLGAVSYYSPEDMALGLLENSALSGEDELKKRTRAITGLDFKQGSSVDVTLAEFDRICHLRHAAVHCLGELGARNLSELGARTASRSCLVFTVLTFQSLVVQCHNAVRSYNQFLFDGIVSRWIDTGQLQGSWGQDGGLFTPLFTLFASADDGLSAQGAEAAYLQLLPTIQARIGAPTRPRRGNGR